MSENEDLYQHDLSCPYCGKKTIKKELGYCKLTICSDYINCNYYVIDELNSIAYNPSSERIAEEKEWYKNRLYIFAARDRKRIKQEFIAREMEKLRKRGF